MTNLWKSSLRVAGVGLASGLLAMAQQTVSARPGAVNYIEGSVTLNGQPLSGSNLRYTEMMPGQVLSTGQGKAEILLTPGVFVRLDDQSALRMDSPSLTNTEVTLQKGRALVEVDQIEKENRLDIVDNGIHNMLLKKGIYQFDADRPSVAVYDGKVTVRVNDQEIDLGKGKELALTGTPGVRLKAQKFDRNQGGELYAWSKLRSEYTAQANLSSAQSILAYNPGWYYGTGWYWNPWYDSWAFVPGASL